MAHIQQTALTAILSVGLLSASGLQAAEQSWAEKMFDKSQIDFGVVARGAETEARVKITNPYRQTVHIAQVRTTCGCSAAAPSQRTLQNGENAFLKVALDTRRFTRRKNSHIIVQFDAPLNTTVRIPVTAYIRTDVVLRPGAVRFGTVPRGEASQQNVEIAYAGRETWAIEDIKTDCQHLATELVETRRADGRIDYRLQVTLQPTAPAGRLREQLFLMTNDADNPRIPVLVEAQVEGDISITPPVVSVGQLQPGARKTVNVVLRGRKPFAIEEITGRQNAFELQARLPETSRRVHVVPLTITAPTEVGKFEDQLAISIAGRDVPVTFKAYGRTVAGDGS